MFSDAYVEHVKRGPFPGQVDPWAEIGEYHHQIHSGMIRHMVDQIRDPLIRLGYVVSSESSLQVLDRYNPDIAVQSRRRETSPRGLPERWNYELAAEALSIDPGEEIDEKALENIAIKERQTGQLVTVLEIISPSNKADRLGLDGYQDRRFKLVHEQDVNVVEIDDTRSLRRMYFHPLTTSVAYHIAIFLPLERPRVVQIGWRNPLKRFALPLRGQVLPVDTHAAYEHSYQSLGIALQIYDREDYAPDKLPFPSTLTAEQRQQALDAVEVWKRRLDELAQET